MIDIDLTGGEVKVLGNSGDDHLFRLSNPIGEEIINAAGLYEAEFLSHLGSPPDEVILDVTEIAFGILTLPVTIINGVYRVRRTNPRRTILKIEVESR